MEIKLQSAHQSTAASTYTQTIKFSEGLFHKIQKKKNDTHFNSLHFYEIKEVGYLLGEIKPRTQTATSPRNYQQFRGGEWG